MKTSSLALLLPALAPFTAAQNPQVDTVYNTITKINVAVDELTAQTQAYNGGFVQQLPLAIDFVPVHLATRKGFYDSLLLPDTLTDADAQRLIEHVNNTLSVGNPEAVRVLKTKKSLFDEEHSTPLIKAGLQLLLSDHLSFSNEVAKRVPAELQADGKEVIDIITVALEDGVTTFSS